MPKERSALLDHTLCLAKRWLVAIVKLLIVLLLVWFVRRALFDAWQQLVAGHCRPHLGWLAVSGLCYLAGTLLCGLFWHRVLRALWQPVSLARVLRAYFIGHLGKYVPGKAMVVILRTGLVSGDGVDTGLVAASVFYETLTMMATGALMASAIIVVWFHQQSLLFYAALATLVAAGLPTLPVVFRHLVRLLHVGRTNPSIAEKLGSLSYRTMLCGLWLTGMGWVMLGLSLWAVLRALGAAEPNPLTQLPLHVAAVAMAMVAGFVAFTPGGVAVREAVLTGLMSPYLGVNGSAIALLSAILLRLVWLVSELLIAGLLGLLYAGIKEQTSSGAQQQPGCQNGNETPIRPLLSCSTTAKP